MVMSVNIHVPSSWQELTLDQLYVVSSVMDRNLDRPTMLFVLLCRLSGIRPVKKKKETVFFRSGKQRFYLEDYQLLEFCNKMSFVLDEIPNDIVNPTSVESHMEDVPFRSYFVCDALMARYAQTGQRKFFRKAMEAVGYRRLCFSTVKIRAIMLWWAGVQRYLQDLYPWFFRRTIQNHPGSRLSLSFRTYS